MIDIPSLEKLLAPLLPGLLGMKITELTPERVTGTMPVRAELCTAGEILHGGAIMAFADTLGAVGAFINLPQGKRTTTVESSTKFIGAAPVNSTITGESTALHRGRSTMVWQTMVRTEDGKLCAVVTQTQMVLG
jgi:uncharacterized protein (TIGR00369 family)